MRFDAERQFVRIWAIASLDILAKRKDVTALAHGDRNPDGRFAIGAEKGLGRIGETAAHGGDIGQAQDASANHEIDVADVVFGANDPETCGASFSSPV